MVGCLLCLICHANGKRIIPQFPSIYGGVATKQTGWWERGITRVKNHSYVKGFTMRYKSFSLVFLLLCITISLFAQIDPEAIKQAAIRDIKDVITLTSNRYKSELRLTILYTNDLHGRMGNMERYATIVDSVRAEVPNILLLDAGDLYRRGPNEKQHGAVEIEILNSMRYDAMTLGNSEFPITDRELYDMSKHTILQKAEFPILCGNVMINGEYIAGVEPYIIKEIEGVKVCIIGVTTSKPWDRGYDLVSRYDFIDPVVRLKQLVAETAELSDIQIALSHAGFFKDLQMQGVSAIIGADSHLALQDPVVIKDGDKEIPIVSAGGESNNYLGRLDLVYELQAGKWELKGYEGKLY